MPTFIENLLMAFAIACCGLAIWLATHHVTFYVTVFVDGK